MPRPPRIQIAGGVYHVTSRGNRRQPVFADDRDRQLFLGLLHIVSTRLGWRCHAYCLMPNHYHVLITIPAPNLSAGIQWLNGVFAQSFNERHHMTGHLFQGRFHAAHVVSDRHLLELSRYLVLNPVRGGLCRTPGEWRWSSYRATVGVVARPFFLDIESVLSQFGSDKQKALRAFRRFVEDGLPRGSFGHGRGLTPAMAG